MQNVLNNLRDLVPKIIGQILVNKSLDTLQMKIIEGINNSKDVLECLSEVGIFSNTLQTSNLVA